VPGRKTHLVGTALTAASVPVLGTYFALTQEEMLWIGIGVGLTILVHPDLDQAESHKGFWSTLWWPYGALVKHRSFVSHFPVVSSIIRAAYLFTMVYALYWLLTPRIEINVPHILYIHLLVGMCMSDWVHIIMDWTSTALKRIGK